jgi:surface antigen
MKRIFSVMVLGGVLAVALTIGVGGLAAKPLGKIIREIGLTPEDFEMLSASGESLYATATPRPGKVVSWTNPESKSHGTAILAAMRDNCAFVQHFVFPKGAAKPKEIRTRVCRNAQGKWQLQP